MTSSILRNLLISFVGFGLSVAIVFPFYAHFFVVWRPGMLVWFVSGCLIAGVAIGIANYWLLNVILVRKLRRISAVATAISNKDLTFTCAMRSNDTIGEIINSFNAMAQTLRDLIGHTSALSSTVSHGSQDTRKLLGNINANVASQSARAVQIETAIEHLAHTVSEISASSTNCAEQARHATQAATDGGAVVQRTVEGMDKIHHVVNDTAEAVANLGKSSEKISAIVAVINEIAEQTNLLALNAAIEAARAGEQGRGFAVVADEVRKLAEKTTEATKEIGGMIRTIQQKTDHVISTIDGGTKEVENGVNLAREAGKTLKEIVGGIERLSEMVRHIAEATHTQDKDVQDIRDNVSGIVGLIEDTLLSTKESANRAENLSAAAQSLDNAVKTFKLS